MHELTAAKLYLYVQKNPGLKASIIASKLGVTRKVINSLIYSDLQHKLVKDDGHCWRAKTDCVESEASSSIQSSNSDVKFGERSIRGNSLFTLEYEHKSLSISINTSHPFITEKLQRMGIENSDAFRTLIETFALAAEKHYADSQLIEELVDDWGTILAREIVN